MATATPQATLRRQIAERDEALKLQEKDRDLKNTQVSPLSMAFFFLQTIWEHVFFQMIKVVFLPIKRHHRKSEETIGNHSLMTCLEHFVGPEVLERLLVQLRKDQRGTEGAKSRPGRVVELSFFRPKEIRCIIISHHDILILYI